ncbi:hypothetical protein FCI23_26905 [Actinacidiphila oryziradicis]|uniref:Arsenate reductase n=2 Tax=Actinacidiphila oryziradicis TaxID=2571141 RepID=A0A4V6WJ85_9ACTN|nr:hypothetical protein FCI23_26905 [Actinacidiphila oryziradicis]
MTWVPTACTLPTAEQPLRVAEFDALFTDALTRVNTISATHTQLVLDGPETTEQRVRDLAARETGCCSFFTFAIDRDANGWLLMDITVPDTQSEVLKALVDRATGAAHARP